VLIENGEDVLYQIQYRSATVHCL